MSQKLLSILGALVLLCALSGCPEPPSPYPPAGLSYFAFADTSVASLLTRGLLRAGRVDLADTTKILALSEWTMPRTVDLYSSENAGFFFRFSNDNALYLQGQNKLKIMTSGNRTVGWLEFNNKADGWLNPSEVKYNGQPVEPITMREPTNPSYLYLLR